MPITLSQARQNAINRRLNALNQNAPVQGVQQQSIPEEQSQTAREQNAGGVLGGVGYTFGKLGTGALRGLEGIWDFVAGGLADLFGADEWAQKQMENSPFDEWNAELDEWYNPSGVMSFVGDVAGGVGQMLPSVAVSLVPGAGPALSTGMFMTSAAGMGVADAARETGELGAKEWLYGTASGAVEGAIEKASGGIGGTRLGTAFGKQIAKSTGGKLAATFVGEGLEEVASDLIDPALRRVTGVDPDAKVDVSQLPNTFLVGGTAGAVLGGGSRLLNARRAGGFNNLNAAEDAASIRDARARGNTLQAEGRLTDKWADTLSKTEKEAATRLSARLQRMDADTRARFVEQNNLGDLFDERGVLLEESQGEGGAQDYNRAAISYSARNLAGRVDQNGNSVLEYQPTKAAVREDIAKAAADIAQLSGGQSRYVVTDSLGTISDGTKINAFYDPNSGIMYIANDADSAGARSYVVSHEYVHSLEGNGQYSRYANEVLADIAQDPELRKKYDYDKYYARYKEAHPNVEEETLNYIVQTEMIADFTAKELLTNEATVRRLVNRNAGLVRRVYEWVKDKIRALTSGGGSRENIAYLRRAEKLLAKALDNPGGGINVSDMDKYVREEKARRDTQGTDAEAETAEAGEARRLKSNNEPATEIRFSLMNEWSFDENVDDILSMSDADARANAAAGNFISIMKHTPDVILNNVEGAEDLEMIIRFDALYLASREKGALKGHYHDLGAEITKKLPNLISDPDAIVRMDNGRLNIFAEMNTAKGNNGIIAIELNTVKDVNSKRNKYNLVVSAFSTKENYVRNLLQKRAESVEYMKKDLSQLKPQLYEWLASVNERSNGSTIRDVSKSVEHVSTEESSSNNSISQNAENVNSKSQKGKRFALPETDSAGASLSREQREFFKDSKVVDDSGRLRVTYHGSPNSFYTFDRGRIGKGNDQFGAGFYFATSEEAARHYGDNVYKTYLNLTNPIVINRTIDGGDLFDVKITQKQAYEILKRHPLIYDPESSPLGDMFEEYWEVGAKDYMIREAAKNFNSIGLLDSDYIAYRDYPNELHEAIRDVLGYDGVEVRFDNSGDRFYVAWFENQIKLTTNKQPTNRSDIRFAISDGRYAKQRAQYNAPKVYSRKDAERIVDSILADQLTFQENYGDLTRKNREQIVDTLWKNLNSLPSGKRTSAALKMADYIIENAALKSYYEGLEADQAAFTIDVLKQYHHKLDLSDIREEIQYHYDTDHSPYLLWSAQKGNGGIAPDVLAAELAEQGYILKAARPSEIFFEIDDAYRDAVSRQRKAGKQFLNDALGTERLRKLRQEIAKEILRGYDYTGKKSLFARLQEEMRNRLDDAGIKLREQAQLFHIKESIFTKAEALKKKNYPLAFEGFDNVKKTLAKIKYRSDINQSSTRDIIKAFGQFYTESNQALEGYYMPEVREAIDNFLAYDGEGKLDLYELRQVNTVLQAADYLLRNYDKAWIGERKISVTNAASEEINVVKENAPVYRYTPLGRKGRLGQALRSIVDMRTLMRWIDGGNSGTMTEMFEQLAHGSTVQTVTVMDLNEGFEKFLKEQKKFYKDLEKTVKFRFNGAEAEITRSEAISLYLTSLQEDGLYHLAFGGFAVGTEAGLRRRYYGKKPYYGKREDVGAYESEALRETRQDMDALFAQFSAAEREYIRIARDLFDNKAKRIKQDVDMKRMGVTNARVENYFPMRVYERGSGRQKPAQGFLEELNLIANQSIHKDRVKGSKQTLMISPVNLVVMNHIRQIAMYNAYAIPLDTFRRVLNKNISVLPDGKTDTAHAVTLKTTIQENAWSDFAKFIEKFELDIQGANTQTDTINKAFRWLRSNYAKFQLGLNIKTMLSQLTSLPMVGSRVGWGNLIKGAISKPNIREMLEYSEWARARVYEGAAYKAQSLVDNLDTVGQLAMKPIGWVDMFTMNRIYNAAKYYIAKRDGLRLDSVECKTKAAEMLEVLGRETQNNSEIAERSAVMRSSNEIMKSIVMFSSDAVKQFSLLVQAFNKISFLKRKIKLGIGDVSALQKQLSAARKEARGALASVAASMTFYVLMGMLVNYGLFAKEPEDDETLVEIFLKNLGGSVTGMIPIVRDLYTFFVEGYELDNFAYDTFNGLTDAVKGISDLIAKAGSGERVTDQEWMLALRKFVYATGQLTGLPTRNIYNQMYGVIKRFSPSAAYEIDSLFYGASTKDLNKAIEKGDDKLSATITQQLLADRGVDASETVAEAFSALYAEGYSLPSGVRDSITYNGEEISLNARQQGIIIDSYEKAAQEAEGLINSAEWDHQSDAVKANALKLLLNYYYYAGVYEATGAYGDSRALMLGEAVDVAKIAIAYGQAVEMTADVDRKGNTISGTKKAKIQSLVNGLRLTAAQKYILMGYLGYKNANGENVVKGYIRSLGLTQEQQNELLEMSGYDAAIAG